MSAHLVSRYASLPQFASPMWQKILNDPIQIALENHTISWGSLDNDDWMTKPVVQVYEEPKTPSRVRFADAPMVAPSAPLKEKRPSGGISLMHLIEPMQQKSQSLMHLITPMQAPKVYPNPSNICTVIIYNLPRTTTHQDLEDNLSQYGVIEHITIPKNMDPSKGPVGSIKGFAMVRFSNPRESAAAVAIEKSCRTQIEFAKSDRK
jgi:RNA recognition motif. (a.k.a. RRM, RBD, or RNP domain)